MVRGYPLERAPLSSDTPPRLPGASPTSDLPPQPSRRMSAVAHLSSTRQLAGLSRTSNRDRMERASFLLPQTSKVQPRRFLSSTHSLSILVFWGSAGQGSVPHVRVPVVVAASSTASTASTSFAGLVRWRGPRTVASLRRRGPRRATRAAVVVLLTNTLGQDHITRAQREGEQHTSP